MNDVNTLLIERIEKIVEILQENSIKMGQLLAVHNEKLNKQDQVDGILFEKIDSLHREVTRKSEEIKNACEKDVRLVEVRLREMEKKMWSIFGALAIISLLVSSTGQTIIETFIETPNQVRLTK